MLSIEGDSVQFVDREYPEAMLSMYASAIRSHADVRSHIEWHREQRRRKDWELHQWPGLRSQTSAAVKAAGPVAE
jgi:hypothetical protein